jgi:hypothetical protein
MSDFELTRLSGYDVNGNPRYVCHYHALLTQAEKNNPDNVQRVYKGHSQGYHIALSRAREIGGKRYRAKWYGGGIVFTDYESSIRHNIKRIVAEAEAQEIKS